MSCGRSYMRSGAAATGSVPVVNARAGLLETHRVGGADDSSSGRHLNGEPCAERDGDPCVMDSPAVSGGNGVSIYALRSNLRRKTVDKLCFHNIASRPTKQRTKNALLHAALRNHS